MAKQPKRWNDRYAQQILNAADRAASDRAFAERRGLDPQRLSYWRTRLERPRRPKAATASSASDAGAFVEVKPKPVAQSTVVEVLLVNGRQLRVSDQADAAAISRLADALEGRC